MDMYTRVLHPKHGFGTIVARIDDHSVDVEYDEPTSWGNPIVQSECELENVDAQEQKKLDKLMEWHGVMIETAKAAGITIEQAYKFQDEFLKRFNKKIESERSD